MCRKLSYSIFCVLAAVSTSAKADITPITSVDAGVDGSPPYMLQSITVGGYTVTVDRLVTGVSTGIATAQPAPYNDITNADNFDLNLFAGRNNENPPQWQITQLGGRTAWADTNGDNPDFFVFETNGNDDFTIEAILPGGVLGQPVNVAQSTWADTGLTITTDGPHNGQTVEGIAFAVTDLLDQNGNGLTNNSVIEGIQITSGGLDPSCFCALPGAPILIATNPDPPNGATNISSPLLEWVAGDTAASHDVYFGTSPDLGPAEFMARYPRDTTLYYHMPGITAGQTYYWRIDEVEADGTTIHTGDVWTFSALSSTAYNPDPPDGAQFVDTEADLSWTAGFGAILHDIYLGTDETEVANGTGDTFKNTWPLTTFDPGTLTKGTTYYWRVDEIEADGTTKHTGSVWRFRTIPEISITDPNLVGWWKFDVGSGTVAIDWSGHGNNGTLANGPQWVDGYDGGALEFDGQDDSVEFASFVPPLQGTITFWINPASVGPRGRIFGGHDAFEAYVENDILANQLFAAGSMPEYLESNATIPTDTWTHVALTYDGTSQKLQIYLNGTLDGENLKADDVWAGGAFAFAHRAGRDQEYYNGLLDDFRIYNTVLTPEQIKETMRGDVTLAWDPKPANGVITDVEKALPLTWSPGEKVAQHDIYLGTDPFAVESADATDTTGIYRGRQTAASYSPAELDWGQTYYWRIDEVNTDATISTGRLWSFTIADYLIVDDFEDYDDFCNRIFFTWTDGWGHSGDPDCGVPSSAGNGTGSTVGNLTFPYAEQTIVHSGRQSMPFEYNNTGTGGKARYSEAQREWASPQDWTRKAVKALTLYFYGDPANAAEQLYVALEDNASQVKVVNHPNPEAAQAAGWQEWNIALAQFSGANLKAIKKLYIGLGNRVSPAVGGSGKIYIDDIRLCRPRCMPSLARPDVDLSGNCIVDYADVEIIASEWLSSGHLVTPQQPGNANLVAHYTLDGNTNDSSGNGHHGTANGFPTYTAGKIGQAINLDGVDDYVDCGDPPQLTIQDEITLACWIKVAAFTKTWETILAKGDDSYRMSRGPGTGNSIHFGCNGPSGGNLNATTTVTDNTWHHVALVYDGSNKIIYIDGVEDARVASTGQINVSTYNLYIGENSQATGRYLTGLVDDVRVYSRALTRAEIASLAGRTEPFSAPFDLNGDDVVDFKDLAVLADAWLEELLWP